VTTVLLYRPSLDFTSGAGQLMLMQLRALRAAGVPAEIGCERGALRFLLRSGTLARRIRAAALRSAQRDRLIVDHGLSAPDAAVVFVHNVATEAYAHLPRADWFAASAAERAFFARLAPAAEVVANSKLVKAALVKHFALPPERVSVHYPGFRSERSGSGTHRSSASSPRAISRNEGSTFFSKRRRSSPLRGRRLGFSWWAPRSCRRTRATIRS
jgi:hypothetical protein